jgi:hypothetical protein
MIPVIYPVVCPLSYPILTPAHVQFTTTSYPNHIFTFIINLVYSIFFLLFIHSIIADIITYGFTLGYISLAMLRSGSLALVCLLLCAPRVSALLDSSSIFCITHLASIYLQFKRSSICLVSLGSRRVHTLSSLDISRLASDVTSNRSDSLASCIFGHKETRATEPHDHDSYPHLATYYNSQHRLGLAISTSGAPHLFFIYR